jgi:hypothetical protein
MMASRDVDMSSSAGFTVEGECLPSGLRDAEWARLVRVVYIRRDNTFLA